MTVTYRFVREIELDLIIHSLSQKYQMTSKNNNTKCKNKFLHKRTVMGDLVPLGGVPKINPEWCRLL